MKIPKWKLAKMKSKGEAMDVDDPKQVKIRENIEAITGAADQLRKCENPFIVQKLFPNHCGCGLLNSNSHKRSGGDI